MLDKWFPLGSGVTPRGDDADLGVGAEAAGSEAQRPAVAPDRREDDVAVRAAVGGGVLECQAGLLWGQQKWGVSKLAVYNCYQIPSYAKCVLLFGTVVCNIFIEMR